jgi:hypothetical protein
VLVQKLTTKVGKQHIDEVGEVINKAIADFEAGAADVEMQDASRRSTPAGASTPGPSRKKAKTNRSPPPAAPSTRPSVDMWADVIMGNTQTRRASSSALFGATAPATPATAAPVAIPAASSSLFGSTIGKQAPAGPRTQPRDRLASPAFAAIQAAIHSELAPKQSAAVEATSTSTSALTSGTDAPEIKTEIQPETVQFVPAAKRTNVQSAVGAGVTAAGLDAATFVPGSISSSSSNGVDLDNNNGSGSSGAAATSAPKPLVDAEGIVSVKKAKNKAKKKAAAAATAEGDVPASTSAVPAKVTRAKVQPEAIPEFDYAAEPDLLDNPTAASRVARRPKKQPKDKKKPCE